MVDKVMRMVIVVALVIMFATGCSGSVGIMPVFAQGSADVWPCFFGTTNGGADNGYMVFYDQAAAAWQTPRLIANDLLQGQWTPQRNGIGWSTAGTWNVSFIENTSNDLEIWESPDAAWQDDAGAWTMTDDDASENWLAVDVETRQNYIWSDAIVGTAPRTFFIDLAAGVPALTLLGIVPAADTTTSYSICLDQMLMGAIHFVGVDDSDGFVKYFNITPAVYAGALNWENDISGASTFPQIISGGYNELYAFYTGTNILFMTPNKIGGPPGTIWTALEDPEAVYTATALDDDYHATWLTYDDTIHVVLVDFVPEGNTTLRYLRRTPNGWSAAIILLTVDSAVLGDHLTLDWPQITVDPYGSIFIYYLFVDLLAGPGGDLRGFHLDLTDYDDFATPATWTGHTNIDGAGTNVTWCVAKDSEPIESDI